MRRASNTPDTMVQYINVVADESLAYDVLKFVDTQDAATTLSLSAESYLETTAGIIIDLEIAGLKGSDDAIRLYPDDTETIYDLATCAVTTGVFSCEDQSTTGFGICSDFDRLFLGPMAVGRGLVSGRRYQCYRRWGIWYNAVHNYIRYLPNRNLQLSVWD